MSLNLGFLTENGWPSCDAASTDTSKFPGTNVYVPTQIGIPNTILKAFGAAFNDFIEPLDQTQCGGWTPNNSVATSNHLGGTAIDINWRDHPMGPEASDPAAGWKGSIIIPGDQVPRLRELLDQFEGLVFWGNDWDSPKDSMHFQMGYDTFNNIPRCMDFIGRKIGPDMKLLWVPGGTTPPVVTPPLPATTLKPMVPGPGGTFWNDVSQYQVRNGAGVPVDDSYPSRVFSFRTNSGDKLDTMAEANATNALRMLREGKLDIVIPYYFFRPGQANCDLHRGALENTGLWNHPQTASMVDVEGANGSVTGDNTVEINDEITRMQGWYGSNKRVVGYYNPNADKGLWRSRPAGVPLIIPQYGRTPGDIASIQDKSVAAEAFAHQFTSSETNTAPWQGIRVDVNWTPYSVPELAGLLGITLPGTPPIVVPPADTPDDPPVVDPPITGPVIDWNSKVASVSRYRGGNNDAIWTLAQLLQFIDARTHEAEVERAALHGDRESILAVKAQHDRGDALATAALRAIPLAYLQAAGVTT